MYVCMALSQILIPCGKPGRAALCCKHECWVLSMSSTMFAVQAFVMSCLRKRLVTVRNVAVSLNNVKLQLSRKGLEAWSYSLGVAPKSTCTQL